MAKKTLKHNPPNQPTREAHRSLIFSACFFVIITAYYHVKPVTRTLFITFIGSDKLPHIWIISALVISLLLPFLLWRARHFSREQLAIGGVISFAVLLLAFRVLLSTPSASNVAMFYLLVDIYSVLLLEQFWGLANAAHEAKEANRWYGIMGSGALLGGICGSASAAMLLSYTSLQPVDLLVVAAILLFILALVSWSTSLKGFFAESSTPRFGVPTNDTSNGRISTYRYATFIIGIALLAQMIEPVIEFYFMSFVEMEYSSLISRTAYLSRFFVVMGVVALAVNLLCTPVILRVWGALTGLALQPLLLVAGACILIGSPTLIAAAILRIFDRSTSYSINRASKELLYNPLSPDLIQRLKSCIDVFGYRLFKIVASLLLLASIEWWGSELTRSRVPWTVLLLAIVWLSLIVVFHFYYGDLLRSLRSPRSSARK